MSAPDALPLLTVRSRSDLVCAVPYLLGFHPERSLVLVGLAEAKVVVTVRADLEDLAGPTGLESLPRAVAAMFRGGAAEVVGIVVDDAAAPVPRDARLPLPWAGLAAEVELLVEIAGGVVGELLLVADGRYWSYLCDSGECCPLEGAQVRHDTSQIPATATYAGLVALPGRECVQRLLDALPDEERAALLPSIHAELDAAAAASSAHDQLRADRSDIRALFAAARAAEADPAACENDPATLARLAAALRRIPVRDAVWVAADDGRLSGDVLWRHLARVLPAPFDAAPLFLVGWLAWRRGNGALARIAADRCSVSDPGYSAAELLQSALTSAVDPRAVPTLQRPAPRRSGAQATRTKM